MAVEIGNLNSTVVKKEDSESSYIVWAGRRERSQSLESEGGGGSILFVLLFQGGGQTALFRAKEDSLGKRRSGL